MVNGNIEIRGRVSIDDLKSINFKRTRILLILVGGIAVTCIILAALGVAASLLSKKNDVPLTNVIPVFFTGSAFLLLLVFLIFTIKKQAERIAASAEETKFIFNEEGLETNSVSSSVKVLWTKFYKIKETDAAFLLFTQNNIAVPIPKHFFESDNQIIELRNLIKEKLGEKAKLKK